MKKNYLFGMALMASLAFFSCTNEVIYVHDGESSEQVSDEQIITLQVSNGGDGLTTRAGRPLYSSEAKQTIDYVRLWILMQVEILNIQQHSMSGMIMILRCMVQVVLLHMVVKQKSHCLVITN